MPLEPLPLDRAYLFTAALALSICQAAHQTTAVELELKWPNDLLRAGHKCGGILAEIENLPGNSPPWLVLGFGLNTSLTELDLAEAGLTGQATNLTAPGQEPASREGLLAVTLAVLHTYRQLLLTDPEAVRREWAGRLVTVGQTVEVKDSGGLIVLDGQAEGVDAGGGLLVRDASGRRHTVQAGDVSVRRAGGQFV